MIYTFVFIVLLLVYIIYLHILLAKKNIFIETTVKRLSGIEKSRSMEEMLAFLRELQNLSQYSSYFQDKFQDKNVISFIAGDGDGIKSYMHYTRYETDAKNIVEKGFRFVESFYKTALPVTNDILDLTIKHNSRKYFGDYLIVIGISDKIVNQYSSEIIKSGIKEYSFENLLTESPPEKNGNGDFQFQLVPQYIKGYVNHVSGEVVVNPLFNPKYDSPAFMQNIEFLKANCTV